MLVNLLSNAVKFTPEDGQVGVEVTSDGDGETVRFTVWDSGPGIATDQLPNLFQPFVQLDSSLSRHYAGTGLGLALVRRLAELHGGGAGVESELGKGSRFYVALPAAIQGGCGSDDVETGQAMNGTEAYDAHGICLLVCDDNPVNLAAVSDYLAAVGFRVITAIDGLQALQRLDEARPAVILMDIQMPEMDGLEATRRIRAIPEYGSVPIIAITALAMPGDRERCLEAGANDFMTKPLSQRALMAKILDLLQVVT
jgi:CheY-like chemotaxis protein